MFHTWKASVASGVLGLALLVAPTVQAQQDGGPPPGGGMPMGGGGFGGPGMGHFGAGGKVVTGAPYSADVTSQSVQTLPDGNSISRSTAGHVARDSSGRTYTQETITGGFMGSNGPMTVTFISDPVAGYDYVLNSSEKTATRIERRARPAGAPNARGGANGPGGGRRGDGSGAEGPQVSDLGTQTLSGVSAQGKSMTHTIPAGAMGNAQPIVSSGEVWTSPDLQVVVLAKRTDPRMGQSTYTLQNIQRAEPPATLFQVPSDYTVKDGKARGFGRGPGGPRGPQQ